MENNHGHSTNNSESSAKNLTEPSALPQWVCEPQKLNVELAELHVGDRFLLKCQGPEVVRSKSDWIIVFPESSKDANHGLKVLKILKDDDVKVDLEVAAYRAIDFTGVEFYVNDGQKDVLKVDGFAQKIKTVLPPQPPMPAPSGPIGPFIEPLSWVFFAILGICFFAVIGAAVRKILATQKRVNFYRVHNIDGESAWVRALGLKSQMGMHHGGMAKKHYLKLMGQLNKFSKSLAGDSKIMGAEATHKVLNQVTAEFEGYMLQCLWQPVSVSNKPYLLKELRKQNKRFYLKNASALQLIFVELEQARQRADQVSNKDLYQLVQIMKQFCFVLYQEWERGEK